MDHTQLIQGFSDQTKLADAHFLVSVVELTPFLSISVCCFSCLGNPLLQVKFAIFFLKSHLPRATTELLFTPSRDYRNFLAFWRLYFSSQSQSHLVKFGWKFNSDYKNNVLAT